MALQTSGAISLNDIYVEANSSYAGGQTSQMNDHSIRYLVEATGKDIPKASNTAISFSDFYGATKFEFGGADDSSAPGFDTAGTDDFTLTDDDTGGGQAYAGTKIALGALTNNTINVYYKDNTDGPSIGTNGAIDDTLTMTINPYYDTSTNSVRNADHGLQWRWAVSGLNVTFTAEHSNEAIYFGYYNVTTFVSQQSYVGTGGDQTNASFTTAWRDWNPIPNILLHLKVYCKANETSTSGVSQTVMRLNSGGYIRIELRHKDDATTADHHYIRKNYISSSNPRFQASSFDDSGS
jgi:hypothetical protein